MATSAEGIVRGFTTPRVAALSGVPVSTLNYWIDAGLVRPSLRPSSGRRATRWWSLQDLVLVRSLKALREAGCPLQTLRKAQEVLDAYWSEAPENLVMYWDGNRLLAIDAWGEVRDLVKHPGQGVLKLVAIPIPRWRREAEGTEQEVDLEHLADLARRRAGRLSTPITGMRAPTEGTS